MQGGVGEEKLAQESREDSILKHYKVDFFFFLIRGTMKPHREAKNCFLDFIFKVHKVTKLEQVFGFFETKLCSYKFQDLHHWIFKPET